MAIREAWIQPLERADHAEIVSGWNEKITGGRKAIYATLCMVCHGTKEQPGSLPTALRFAEGQFKNGADPYSMFITLTKGFGQMVPQPQYTTAQKYAVDPVHPRDVPAAAQPSQWLEITPAYLASLPKGFARAEAEQEDRSLPPYAAHGFGPALFWTLSGRAGEHRAEGHRDSTR